ncbi:MAG: hypothetical protein KDA80_22930 [Planctomycetaceae bacterium]|nr:hypothetical protein [Planctomycetaceae bacterium]
MSSWITPDLIACLFPHYDAGVHDQTDGTSRRTIDRTGAGAGLVDDDMWKMARHGFLFVLIAVTTCQVGWCQNEAVDFFADVSPLLRMRCVHCHGPERQDGDLRLDSRLYAEKGGHSGTSLLGTGDDNEILRRVTTNDTSIRMPKGARPLPPQEIEVIRRWAFNGADWPSEDHLANDFPRVFDDSSTTQFEFTWKDLTDWKVWRWPVAKTERFLLWRNRMIGPLFAILIFAWFCERQRLAWIIRQKQKVPVPMPAWRLWFARIPLSFSFSLILLVLLGFSMAFYQSQARQADAALATQAETIRDLRGLGKRTALGEEVSHPIPVRLHHPRRLGGVYYRGNDERSPELFNGGFYRTATMSVELQTFEREPLAWGDVIDSRDLLLHFRIEQSPHTAEALFADRIWNEVFASSLGNGEFVEDFGGQIVNFEKTSDNVWEAWFPIAFSMEKDATFQGTVYLHRGKMEERRIVSQPHYGAVYDIRISKGQIDPASELWMGYTYKTGSVYVIPEGRIAEEEWFSFRPIPEIEDPPKTTDPGLLGVSDHVSNRRDSETKDFQTESLDR